MVDVSRRSAVFGMASAAGVAVLQPSLGLAQGASPRMRENIIAFARDDKKVTALKAAVGLMKKRSKEQPSVPNGWTYWGSIHGTDASPPPELAGLYNQCHHSEEGPSRHFLSWHRAYLYFFERVLSQAAQEATGNELALPYWDWYAQPSIPQIFTDGSADSNPLWHNRQNLRVDSRSLLRSALQRPSLLGPRGFSYLMEMNPHNRVHGLLGSDMGDPELASRDPIFFLHHANVDRLWSIWSQNAGRAGMPNKTSEWARQTFQFSRDNVWVVVADNLRNPAETLGYRYDDEMPPRPETSVAVTERETPASRPFQEADDLEFRDRKNEPFDIADKFDTTERETDQRQVAEGSSSRRQASSAEPSSGVTIDSTPVVVEMRDFPRLRDEPTETQEDAGLWLVLSDIDVSSLEGSSITVSARVKDEQGVEQLIFITELNSFTLKVASRKHHSDGHVRDKTEKEKATIRTPIDHLVELTAHKSRTDVVWDLVFDPGVDQSIPGTARSVSIGSVRVETR